MRRGRSAEPRHQLSQASRGSCDGPELAFPTYGVTAHGVSYLDQRRLHLADRRERDRLLRSHVHRAPDIGVCGLGS